MVDFIVRADTPEEVRDNIVKWLDGMAASKSTEAGMASRVSRRKECTAQSETYKASANFIRNIKIRPKKTEE